MSDMPVSIDSTIWIIFSLYTVWLGRLFLRRPRLFDLWADGCFALLLAVACYLDAMHVEGVLFVVGLRLLCVGISVFSGWLKFLLWTFLAVGVLALSVHLIPGIARPLVFGPEYLGGSALAFKLYANIDKALAGALLLSALHINLRSELSIRLVKRDALIASVGIVLILGLALLLGVGWDPKLGPLTFAFMFFNLCVTCVAEETFFRKLIQVNIERALPTNYAAYLAVFLTAVLFMLAHFHTGEGAFERLALIFCAGLLYGYVYMRHRSLVNAILTHFGLNVIHFNFFTYPATF